MTILSLPRPALLAPFALLAMSAMATAEQPMILTYLEFENAVPHIDLAACPAALAGEGRFCRLTTHAEQLNVFAFSEAGDQPLVGFQSWPSELLADLMN
jgi:hypothetical protein